MTTYPHQTTAASGVRRIGNGHLVYDYAGYATVECLGSGESYTTEPFPNFCPGCGDELTVSQDG